MELVNLNPDQLTMELQALWDKAYQAGDAETSALVETTLQALGQFQQGVVVLEAEREKLYTALTRLQSDRRKLQDMADANYYEGYNAGAATEQRKHGNPDDTYNEGFNAGQKEAQDYYEPILRQYRDRANQRGGMSHS